MSTETPNFERLYAGKLEQAQEKIYQIEADNTHSYSKFCTAGHASFDRNFFGAYKRFRDFLEESPVPVSVDYLKYIHDFGKRERKPEKRVRKLPTIEEELNPEESDEKEPGQKQKELVSGDSTRKLPAKQESNLEGSVDWERKLGELEKLYDSLSTHMNRVLGITN